MRRGPSMYCFRVYSIFFIAPKKDHVCLHTSPHLDIHTLGYKPITVLP